MGGGVVLALAEKYPSQYDGAMPICGVVGGSHLTIDQIWGARAAFDHHYPGVVPGDTLSVPDALTFNDGFLAVQNAVFTDPTGALSLWAEDSLDINAADFFEVFVTLAVRIGVQLEGTTDLVSRSQGHSPFDNFGVVYDDPALDAGIERFASTPDAEAYFDRYYEPTGALQIPVLTLHNIRDYLVPIEHEQRFAEIVDAAGSSALLVQQTVDRFEHCGFRSEEVVNGLLALVDWVENGVVPPAGDVTIP